MIGIRVCIIVLVVSPCVIIIKWKFKSIVGRMVFYNGNLSDK